MITRVLQDKRLLKIALASGPPEDAHSVMQAIEQARARISLPSAYISYNILQELKEADFGETQERELQEDFSELRRWVEKLPPMVDRPSFTFPCRALLIAASVQLAVRSSGQATTLLPPGAPRTSTPANGPARRCAGVDISSGFAKLYLRWRLPIQGTRPVLRKR